MPQPLFNTAHYNIIAAQIRKHYQEHGSSHMQPYAFVNAILDGLVLDLAFRFLEDNPFFDANKFITLSVPEARLKDIINEFKLYSS
jgi:hypothetical protein